MKNNNKGFVLIETLIVTLLLTVTLMTLYSSFSYMVTKTRDKSNHDSMETLYKTYFIKDLINSAYATFKGEYESKNPFIYYADQLAGEDVCQGFDYSGNGSGIDVNKIIKCHVGLYATDLSYHLYNGRDPIYEASLAYNIDYIYFLNYAGLYDATGNLKSDVVNKIFDVSTIDYIRSQKSTDTNNVLLIKYDEDFTYPVGYDAGELEIAKDIYHSSIPVRNVNRNAAVPLTLYDDDEDKAVEWEEVPNGDRVVLPSNTFANNPNRNGQVLVGWTTTSNKVNTHSATASERKNTQFNQCVNATNAGNKYSIDGEEAFCYKVNSNIIVSDSNRELHAVWCGNKNQSLDELVSCQGQIAVSHPGPYGIMDGVNIYNNYACSASNNYVVFAPNHKNLAGQVCFKILGSLPAGDFEAGLSTVPSPTYNSVKYKLMYAGIYGINGCYFPTGISYGGQTKKYSEAETLTEEFYNKFIAAYTGNGTNLFVPKSYGLLDVEAFTYHIGVSWPRTNGGGWNKSRVAACVPTYLKYNSPFWLRQFTNGDYSNNKYYVANTDGMITEVNQNHAYAVLPVVTAKGSAVIWGGAGTAENPYILAKE